MTTVVLQHVSYLGRNLGFFKKCIFSKIAANFPELRRRHMFTDTNRNIIKNRVEKRKWNKFCQKITVSDSNRNFKNIF